MRVKKLHPMLRNFFQWYLDEAVANPWVPVNGFAPNAAGLCVLTLAYAYGVRKFKLCSGTRLAKMLSLEFVEDGLNCCFPWGYDRYQAFETRGCKDPLRVQWVRDKLAADKVARDV